MVTSPRYPTDYVCKHLVRHEVACVKCLDYQEVMPEWASTKGLFPYCRGVVGNRRVSSRQ